MTEDKNDFKICNQQRLFYCGQIEKILRHRQYLPLEDIRGDG